MFDEPLPGGPSSGCVVCVGLCRPLVLVPSVGVEVVAEGGCFAVEAGDVDRIEDRFAVVGEAGAGESHVFTWFEWLVAYRATRHFSHLLIRIIVSLP